MDDTGMGRWSGIHLRGRHNNTLSIITGYRSCGGSKLSAPLGSTFHREYEHIKTLKCTTHPNPRLQFIKDIGNIISKLQEKGNMIILMLDANGVINQDGQLREMVERLQVYDLQISDPAPSTYIGSPNRRIDDMF